MMEGLNATAYFHLVKLSNTSYSNGTTAAVTGLPVPKSSIFIPAMMFFLGVFGNSLGIVSLLMYRWRTVHCDVQPTNTSQMHNEIKQQGSPRAYSFGNDLHGPQRQFGPDYNRRHSSASMLRKSNLDVRNQQPSPMPVRKSTSRQERRQKFGAFHTLVLGLLTVDLFGNIFTSPVTLILYSNNITIIAATGNNHLCNYSAFMMMFLGIVTMATLTAMSVERVISIRHAYFYHRHVTSRKASIVIVLLVIFSAAFTALPAVGFGKIRAMFPYTWCFADWYATDVEDKVYNYMYASIGAFMIFATVVCNFSVVAGLIDMKKRIKTSRKRHLRYETQMIIQLMVMTCVYLICWLPLVIRIVVNQATYSHAYNHDRVAIWLASTNPILDPWVYILFRRSVIKRLAAVTKSILCIPSYHQNLPQVRIQNNNVAKKSSTSKMPCDVCESASAANLSLPINAKNSRFEYVHININSQPLSTSSSD